MGARRHENIFIACLPLALLACTGNIALETMDGSGENGPGGPGSAQNPPSTFEAPNAPPKEGCEGDACLQYEPVPEPALRAVRLTHAEWVNSIGDLFGIENAASLAANFEPDAVTGNFDTDATSRSVSALLWNQYQSAAESVAQSATASSAALAKWLPSNLPTEANAKADAFITQQGLRIFRRPLKSTETMRLRAIFDAGSGFYPEMDAFSAGVRLFLEAALQSPQFIYRIEESNAVENGLVKLSGYELATRLSFSLLQTTPSDALLASAGTGQLDTEEGVLEMARSMLASERGYATLERFFEQHFVLHKLDDIPKDAALFSDWNASVAQSAADEVSMFLSAFVRGEEGLSQLLLSRAGYVNTALASIYGVSASGSALQSVQLPESRPGILTRVGFLAANGTLRDPDPIHRGVFVNQHLLCRTLIPPDDIPDNLMPTGTTNRDRIDSITGEGTCGAGCHATILNPPGFALENFDAIGQFRETDNGQTVDATGTYTFEDGTTIGFDGAQELSQELANARDFHVCQTERLVEYFAGQVPGAGLAPLVQKLGTESVSDQTTLIEIIARMMSSRALRFRSAEFYQEGQ